MPDGLINLTVDGVPVSVAPGTLVIEAAKQAGGLVPHYRYYPGLPVAGGCRMCLVQVENPPQLHNRRATQGNGGVGGHTQAEPVQGAPRGVLQLPPLNHPPDRPTCA